MSESSSFRQTATAAVPNPLGYLRSEPFDLTLILGVAALALLSGWAFVNDPRLFPKILMIDLWFLGFQHVVATYTRLVFDVDSFRENKFLVVWLPIIVAGCTVAAVYAVGPWILATTYLYWQWFHYMRQSYGISRIYQRKAKLAGPFNDYLEYAVIYLPATWGILYRSYQATPYFLGLELRVVPVPAWVVQAAALLTLAALAVWAATKIKALLEHRLDVAHTLFQATHVLVFWTAYLGIKDINFGWLVINIWHNAQYVIFVWMYNNNRFKNGVDARHKFLSTISQTKNAFWYFLICVLLSTFIYKSIDRVLSYFTISTLTWAVIVYQVINFHHYVVDGVVWKIRQKPVQKTLGLSS